MAIPITSTAASLGSSLGQGITGALGLLTEQKLQDLQERRKEASAKREQDRLSELLKPVYGEYAPFIAGLPEKLQASIMSNPEPIMALLQQSGQQQTPGIQGMAALQQQGQPNNQLNFAQVLSQALQPKMTPYQQQMVEATKERAAISREKQEMAQQKDLDPFLSKTQEAVINSGPVLQDVNRMMQILNQKADKWPSLLKTALPESLRSLVLRDPELNEYNTKINQLVVSLSHSLKGVPSKYKMQLIEKAKVMMTQPPETQKAILNEIQQAVQHQFDVLDYQNSLQDKETGKYPKDIKTKVTKYNAAFYDPLHYPEFYENGTIYNDPISNKNHVLTNGKWKVQ